MQGSSINYRSQSSISIRPPKGTEAASHLAMHYSGTKRLFANVIGWWHIRAVQENEQMLAMLSAAILQFTRFGFGQ